MRSLDARVCQLDETAPQDDHEMMLIFIVPIGVEDLKIGPERVIQYDSIGLKSMRDERRWSRLPAESVDEMKCRVSAELSAEGHKVLMGRLPERVIRAAIT